MPRILYFSILFGVAWLSSCGETIPAEQGVVNHDPPENSYLNVSPEEHWEEFPSPSLPMTIEGDFNGDMQQDTGTLQLIAKNGTIVPMDSIQFLVPEAREGACNIIFSDKRIPQLRINIRAIGLAFLENEGDLNNDGRDELSFVEEGNRNFIRTFSVVSFIHNKWELVAESSVNIGYIYDNEPPYENLVRKGRYQNTLELMHYQAKGDAYVWETKEVTFANEIQI